MTDAVMEVGSTHRSDHAVIVREQAVDRQSRGPRIGQFQQILDDSERICERNAPAERPYRLGYGPRSRTVRHRETGRWIADRKVPNLGHGPYEWNRPVVGRYRDK